MNRRLIWSAVAAIVAVAAAVPVLAQDRQPAPQREGNGALAEHKAQEARDNAEAAERAQRREAARSGKDPRSKDRPQREEEEERERR